MKTTKAEVLAKIEEMGRVSASSLADKAARYECASSDALAAFDNECENLNALREELGISEQAQIDAFSRGYAYAKRQREYFALRNPAAR